MYGMFYLLEYLGNIIIYVQRLRKSKGILN